MSARTECLGCELINTAPVTLTDARVVCSSCPAWRLETEAREVLSKPLEARKAYLEKVEEKRGKVGCDELKAVITVQWKRKNADQA